MIARGVSANDGKFASTLLYPCMQNCLISEILPWTQLAAGPAVIGRKLLRIADK